MGEREVSRPYRVLVFRQRASGFLCFLFLCPQYLPTSPEPKRKEKFSLKPFF